MPIISWACLKVRQLIVDRSMENQSLNRSFDDKWIRQRYWCTFKLCRCSDLNWWNVKRIGGRQAGKQASIDWTNPIYIVISWWLFRRLSMKKTPKNAHVCQTYKMGGFFFDCRYVMRLANRICVEITWFKNRYSLLFLLLFFLIRSNEK